MVDSVAFAAAPAPAARRRRASAPRARSFASRRRRSGAWHMCAHAAASSSPSAAAAAPDTDGDADARVDAGGAASLEREVNRRRNLAIISHPDAGKTTLTEKLLLYGGAIQQAGSVRARRAGHKLARSDWMKLEQERGISITSTVLTFRYGEHHVNILDTPGHQDFSEDTYRTLAAADNVVMLVDAAKGLEPQTRKLFEVCRMRKLPTLTFVNKMDRPAMNPFEIMDEIEREFGLRCVPAVWPVGDGERFRGVLHRATQRVHLFQRGAPPQKPGGAARPEVLSLEHDAQRLREALGEALHDQLMEDVEILDEMGHAYDREEMLSGEQTVVYFGSAMTNFGVQLFLDEFIALGRAPAARASSAGEIEPARRDFSGFVFKLQANMDARHRDRLAFVRIVSGKYERGMKVSHSRLGDRQVSLNQAQKLFAHDRESVELAFPGDIVGLNNPGVFSIGDSIYTGSRRVVFPGIPSFSPEMFAYVRNPNPSQYKNFRKGLDQLLEEGAVQMLRAREDEGNEDAILAAVGQLQFDVVQQRLRDEYNVEVTLEPLGFRVARWVLGGSASRDDGGGEEDSLDGGDGSAAAWRALDACGRLFGVFYAKDRWQRPVLLFKNQWNLEQLMQDHAEKLRLRPCMLPPQQRSA